MAEIGSIYDAIDLIAPCDSALDFDNVGLLVGDKKEKTDRVLLTLDITRKVVEEACSLEVKLIVSHHPVIFHPLRSLNSADIPYLLAEKGIAALCCHTNLDLSPAFGTNTALAAALGLREFTPAEDAGRNAAVFCGELEQPMEPDEFAGYVKEKLKASGLKYHPGSRLVRRVFLCSGAGGEGLSFAAAQGADAFVTGELKHHEALEAAVRGITAVEAGHYETERPVVPFLAAYLQKKFPNVEFICSSAEQPPMRWK